MFGYGMTRRQSVNYTISYRAAHAAAVRYSWVLQDQNLSELILLYNTAQFKKAADTYECDSLLLLFIHHIYRFALDECSEIFFNYSDEPRPCLESRPGDVRGYQAVFASE